MMFVQTRVYRFVYSSELFWVGIPENDDLTQNGLLLARGFENVI